MTQPRQEPPAGPRAGPAARKQTPDAGRGGRAEAASARAGGERCGPLLIERHRKADGRQLILYRRVADDG
jgi:hypothetical protein